MRQLFICILISTLILSCTEMSNKPVSSSGADIHLSEYFDYGDTGVQMAGIKMIPVKTPAGEFKVWTKRVAVAWRASIHSPVHGML
jgi:proline iminopeptidase